MRVRRWWAFVVVLLACSAFAQQPGAQGKAAEAKKTDQISAEQKLKDLLEANVKTEWEAFKNKDKKAYSDLLADDFVAVEDDGEGMRSRTKAANEVDRSVVLKYYLNALRVMPIDPNAAFVTYELTMEFPLKAQARFKRVLICELWLKRDGAWKVRYYQETRAK